jgi:nucleoside-diphosphate-sugar epimerase
VTLVEVVDLLEDLLARPISVEHVFAAPGEARYTHGDGSRAAEELAFVPQTPLAEGLAAQLEWTLADVPTRVVAA